MAMLADLVELVIGVDTHKETHTAAVVAAATGAVLDQATVTATPAGYQQLLKLADQHDGRRVWAIESTGGYGAGLTRFLQSHAEQVVELDRPKRAARRHGAKSDPLDATRAAREALGREQLAQPRAPGRRAALSVRLAARRSAVQAAGDAQRQLHALVTAAPETLRGRLRGLTTPRLVSTCARLRQRSDGDVQTAATVASLRALARRSSSWRSRSPSTPGPSPSSCGPGDPSCSPELAWARSWPHRCCAPGPILAAAAATPPSPCSPAPRRFQPPAARRSGSGSTAPATANSTRPYM
jgi:transposase